MVTGQSETESFIETTVDTSSGFIISWAVMLWLIPLFYPEYQTTIGTSFGIVAIFTITSFIRKYFWRRVFVLFAKRIYLWLLNPKD